MADAQARPKSKKTGRPSTYTEKLAKQICSQIAVGRSLVKICSADDMPSDGTVYRWLAEHQSFQEMYARAREQMVVFLGEELLQIADDATQDTIEVTTAKGETYTQANHAAVQRARLQVDTRKWLMAKLMPRKYGERATEAEADTTDTRVVVEGGMPDDAPETPVADPQG